MLTKGALVSREKWNIYVPYKTRLSFHARQSFEFHICIIIMWQDGLNKESCV